MTKLKWDQPGERRYENGIDRGVLYIPDAETGVYDTAAAWNGLTSVTETPSGAEPNKQYADNIAYVNLLSAEEFALTVEAFTYPKLFEQCDGLVEVAAGVVIAQQTRKAFGLAYRSLIGTDLNADAGYKVHLAYGCLAAPSEKAFETVNDSPEAQGLSWDVSTSSVQVPGFKSTALLTIDSTQVSAAALADLEEIIYGTDAVEPRLPLPEEVIELFTGGVTTEVELTGANAPTFNEATDVITLPAVAGINWFINGEERAPGAQPALQVGQDAFVTATADDGFQIRGDDDWAYSA